MMVYGIFTKNAVSRPLVSACSPMNFWRIGKILVQKIYFKSQEKGDLTKGPFSESLFISI